jgi:hypothetical protein
MFHLAYFRANGTAYRLNNPDVSSAYVTFKSLSEAVSEGF